MIDKVRQFSPLLSIVLTFVLVIGLMIPSVSADTISVIVKDDESFKVNGVGSVALLYVDNNIPLSIDYLRDHPDYSFQLECVRGNIANYSWRYLSRGLSTSISYNYEYFSQYINEDTDTSLPLTISAQSNLSATFKYVYTGPGPLQNVIDSVGSVTSIFTSIGTSLLEFIAEQPLILFWVGLAILSIIFAFIFRSTWM